MRVWLFVWMMWDGLIKEKLNCRIFVLFIGGQDNIMSSPLSFKRSNAAVLN
jgi:hypothetical protein